MPDINDELHRAVIIKGFIDAKDEKHDVIYGAFIGLAASRTVKYIGVLFGHDKIDPEMPWQELLVVIRNAHANSAERNPAIVSLEDQLHQCIDMSKLFQGVAKTRSIKQAEQAISRFCNEQLQLKAVTFAQFLEAGDFDIATFLGDREEEKKETGSEPSVEGQSAPEGEEPGEPAEGEEPKDLFIRCEPILDPVGGVALSDLSVGDKVYGRLPEDSPFFKLFVNNFPDFDGIMTGEVSGVFVNELGTATVSLAMADGISGLMKMSGKVRVKVVDRTPTAKQLKRLPLRYRLHKLPPEVVFAGFGIVVLLGLIAVIVYILN